MAKKQFMVDVALRPGPRRDVWLEIPGAGGGGRLRPAPDPCGSRRQRREAKRLGILPRDKKAVADPASIPRAAARPDAILSGVHADTPEQHADRLTGARKTTLGEVTDSP